MSHSLAVTDLAPASPAEWFISCQRPGAACRFSGPDGSHAAVLHAALSNGKHHRPAFSRSRGKSQAAITAAVGAAPAHDAREASDPHWRVHTQTCPDPAHSRGTTHREQLRWARGSTASSQEALTLARMMRRSDRHVGSSRPTHTVHERPQAAAHTSWKGDSPTIEWLGTLMAEEDSWQLVSGPRSRIRRVRPGASSRRGTCLRPRVSWSLLTTVAPSGGPPAQDER